MKLGTLVIIGLLAVIAYALLQRMPEPPPAELIVSTPSPTVAPNQIKLAPPVRVLASQLVVVRGRVEEVKDGLAVVNCDWRPEFTTSELRGLNDVGNPAFAEVAKKQMTAEVFGPLQANGSNYVPKNHVRGIARIAGVATVKGDGVNMVAAPLASGIYTADFTIGAPTPSPRVVVTPIPSPEPRQIAREIERKYGTQKPPQ